MTRHYIDCREIPSEAGCSVAITADRIDELVNAAVDHAVHMHHDADSPELRVLLRDLVHEGTPQD